MPQNIIFKKSTIIEWFHFFRDTYLTCLLWLKPHTNLTIFKIHNIFFFFTSFVVATLRPSYCFRSDQILVKSCIFNYHLLFLKRPTLTYPCKQLWAATSAFLASCSSPGKNVVIQKALAHWDSLSHSEKQNQQILAVSSFLFSLTQANPEANKDKCSSS